MTRVNLLPPEVRSRRQIGRLTRAIIAAAVVVVVLLVGFFAYQVQRYHSVTNSLKAQQSQNAALSAQAAGLERYAQLKQELSNKQQTVQQLTATVVLWSGVLRNLSMVIPSDVYLTSVSGNIQVATSSTGSTSSGLVGTIQFQGVATSYPAVALWLTRLQEVTGWTNAWITSGTKSASDNTIAFSGSIDLTPQATSPGGAS